jgi:hypothetical protein
VTSQTVNLLAASPGAVKAMDLAMVAGSPLSTYENDTAQHVAMIDTTTAATLGISPARLPSHPPRVRQRHRLHHRRRLQFRAARGQ